MEAASQAEVEKLFFRALSDTLFRDLLIKAPKDTAKGQGVILSDDQEEIISKVDQNAFMLLSHFHRNDPVPTLNAVKAEVASLICAATRVTPWVADKFYSGTPWP